MKHRTFSLSLLSAALLTGLFGCTTVQDGAPAQRTDARVPAASAAAPGQSQHTSQLDRIRKAGVLRVGVFGMVPWAMTDRQGAWTGFDVDLANRLAEDLGVRVEFVRVSWTSAADDTAEGKVDLTTGLWPGPRRGLVVNFSEPYATVGVQLVVHRARASKLTRLSDYDAASVRIGVRAGGLSETVARERLPKATIVPFDSDEAQLEALSSGKVVALAARSPVPAYLVAHDAKKFAVPFADTLARRSEVFAIPRGDADFLAYLNAWVRYQEETGWLGNRRAYWLNTLAWQSRL